MTTILEKIDQALAESGSTIDEDGDTQMENCGSE